MAFQYRSTEAGSLPRTLTEGYRAPHPTGTVIAIGGHADKTTLSYVKEALRGNGKVLVTTLASEVPQERFEKTQQAMESLGEELVHLERSQLALSMDKIASGSVFFMAGGNQDRLMQEMGNYTKDRIKQIHRLGGTFAGTSAGAAVMGDLMVVGDLETKGETWHISSGLGLVSGTIIDQHFSEEQREERLRKAAQDSNKLGVGLDENTGIVARNGEFEVIGVGGVHVFDRGVEEHLARGDRYSIDQKRILTRAH